MDEIMYNSLKYIIENDIDNDNRIESYFEIDENRYGELKTIELKENGSEIKVTNSNKLEYVDLVTNHRLKDSIIDQISAFYNGFNSIIDHKEIRIFCPNELNLLICGISEIDVDDFKKNVEFDDDYSIESPVVKLFFDSISKWNQNDLAKLLIFITGSSQISSIGFKYFKDKGNPIKISNGGQKERLPVAHTCFNKLELPHYDTEDELNEKFFIAINEDSFQLK